MSSRGSLTSTCTPAADLSDAQREAARQERRRVIANNKAWGSATTVRTAWLRSWLTRKTAPKGTAQFCAAALASGEHALTQAMERSHPVGRALLGIDSAAGARVNSGRTVTDLLDRVSDGRAQVVTLGLRLGAYEAGTGRHSWRNVTDGTRRYLTFLTAATRCPTSNASPPGKEPTPEDIEAA